MNQADSDWLWTGRGSCPQASWSFTTDAPLVSLQHARETGETLLADASGGMYLLDRGGRVITLSRGFQNVSEVAWSDAGEGGVVVTGTSRLSRLNHQLEVLWSIELPAVILAVAVDPYGHYVGVSLANGKSRLYDSSRQLVGRFETLRPLSYLRFVATLPHLVGASEYGLVCCHGIDGEEFWNEKLWSNVGDLSITGNASRIYLAGFNQGIQTFDSQGRGRESYVVEGTPNLVASSFAKHRLAVSTLERRLYFLDSDGELLWGGDAPEDITRIVCDPLGFWLMCGFESGRVMMLEWDTLPS